MLVPAGFVAPFAAYAGDRFRHDRVLLAGYLVQAATFALSALALYADASPVITIAALTAASSAVTMTRPAQGVLFPAITHSPADLTAANAVSGLAEGLGLCLGPLVAGFLLLRGDPGDVFAVFALVSVVNTALVFRIGFDDGSVHERPGTSARAILAGSFGGFQYVARDRRVLAIVAVLAGVTVLFGALDVLFVAVAIGYFGESESWAGYLNASVGFGAIAGAAAAVVLVGRRRLTPAFAISASVKGLAIAALAAGPEPRRRGGRVRHRGPRIDPQQRRRPDAPPARRARGGPLARLRRPRRPRHVRARAGFRRHGPADRGGRPAGDRRRDRVWSCRRWSSSGGG